MDKRYKDLQYLYEDGKEKMNDEIYYWKNAYENCEKKKTLLKTVLSEYNKYLTKV